MLIAVFMLTFVFNTENVEAVDKVIGASVFGPVPLSPGVLSFSCIDGGGTSCPDNFDVDITSPGRVFGENIFFPARSSCLVNINNGLGTWSNCPTNYPGTATVREIAVTTVGTILSVRSEGFIGFCRLDRSTDQGNSWTTVIVVSGGTSGCSFYSAGYMTSQRIRCSHNASNICIINVEVSGIGSVMYRSVDDGITWFPTFSFSRFWIQGELFYDPPNVIFSQVSGGDDSLTSVDDGLSYVMKSGDVADTRNCSGVTNLAGLLNGTQQICNNAVSTRIKFISGNALTSITPIQPTIYTYHTARDMRVGKRGSRLYIFAITTTPSLTGRIFVSLDEGVSIIEMPESVGVGIGFGQVTGIREINGNLVIGITGGALGKRIMVISN